MAVRKHGNNLRTFLLSNITSSDTSMVVDNVSGFPTIGAGEVFRVTLSQNGGIEIVEVTAVSVNTLTITRAMEGTVAKPYTNGAIVELRATADSYDRKQDLLDNTTTTTVTPASTDRVLIQDASDSYKLKNVLFSSFGGGGGGSGDVVGPSSATGNTIALFDGTTGKLIKELVPPVADRIIFYDFSASTIDYLTLGTNLSISGTTLNATGGGDGGSQTPWTTDIDTAGYKLTNAGTSSGVTISNTNTPVTLEGSYLAVQRTSGYSTSMPIHLYEGPTNGSDYIILKAPDSLAGTYNFILPDNAPTNGYYLKTDGTKTFWAAVASGGVADGTYADIVVSSSGTTWKLNTYAASASSSNRVVVQHASNGYAVSYLPMTDIAEYATKVGTINTGTWQGTVIDANYGGTGYVGGFTNGQLLIGNSSTGKLSRATLTSSDNSVAITNGAGTINLSSKTSTAISAYRNGTQSIGTATFTKIQMNVENFDTGNTFDNTTSYRITPTIAGKYFISMTASLTAAGTTAGQFVVSAIYKNGAAVLAATSVNVSAGNSISASCNGFFDANGSTDYFEFFFYNSGAASTIRPGSDQTFFGSCLMEKN